jgi:hypothetical protein
MANSSLWDALNIPLDSTGDPKVLKETIRSLFNIIEDQAATTRQQAEQIQRLRDEVSRLKGEQGKPDVKPRNRNQNISSEEERKQNKRGGRHNKSTKNDKIKINRTEVCPVDKDALPPDAVFKGYDTVIVQDLKVQTDHIAFQKELYYSTSEHKTYRGTLPPGYEGSFGPTIKTLALVMKNVCNMSSPKILEFFGNFGVQISNCTLSNLLIKNQNLFHEEKKNLVEAGLEATSYQQMDDTGARVKGENHHTHILCNPFFTAYFTRQRKDRLTVLDILKNGRPLTYMLNQETFCLMKQLRVDEKHIQTLGILASEKAYSKKKMLKRLKAKLSYVPDRTLAKILEAAAIAAYHAETGFPVVKIIVVDDAPQFKLLTGALSLCWIHDGRHYKKLTPVIKNHQQALQDFLTEYWNYYRQLLRYKETPSETLAKQLADNFDTLFSTRTGYEALDDRILKTQAKKQHLLLVLKHPELPLHNNASELGARVQVRKRDVSLHTMTDEGTRANDTFLTLAETCKKLGVSAYAYFFDRIQKSFQLPLLADLIRQQANRYPAIPSGP